MLTPDHDTRTPYPRLSEEQKQRVLADLLVEYQLDNLRPVRDPRSRTAAEMNAHE